MTTEDDFQAALDANPNDHQSRLVFADWLQEHGDPRAEGYRALGVGRKQPYLDAGRGWAWYRIECVAPPAAANLPRAWRDAFRDVPPGGNYASRRAAEDAAALAFSKLPPERRAELSAARVVG